VGVAGWWALSKASSDGDCEVDAGDDERPDLCLESGITVMILGLVFGILSAVVAVLSLRA
jgi:hypothetical protein